MYTWDAANRLVSADVGGVVSTFAYNGLGQRTSQTVGGVTTEYVLDVATGLPEVIVATTGGASTYYVQIQGQILAQHGSGAWAYILPDHLGSVRQLTNAGGQVTLAQSYDPFGNLFEAAGSGASEFGYTGEWWDSQAELLYLRARYYQPNTGRFVAKDPWEGDDLQPQSLNGWSYVESNPVNRVDPSGRCWGPLEFLRDIPYYDKTCENLDMAILIAGHPYASPCDKARAIAYVEWAAISHLILAEALAIAGYSVLLEAGVFGGEICQKQGCFEPPPEGEPVPLPTPPQDQGQGQWGPRRGTGGAEYERQVREHLGGPPDKNYHYNGTAYDAWDPNTKTFVDAKDAKGDWYTDRLDPAVASFREEQVLDEARRQVESADSNGVEWWTNNEEAVRYLTDLFGREGIPIRVERRP